MAGEGGELVFNEVHGAHRPQKPTSVINHDRLAALDLVTLVSVPSTLAVLARLNIFETLARAGVGAQLTAQELAKQAVPGKSINVNYLERMLRLMSGKKILREAVSMSTAVDGTPVRRYGLEPIAKFLVDDAENGSLVHLLLMCQSPAFLRPWEQLYESVVDDSVKPFARAHGGLNAWEYCKSNPEFDKVFNKAMSGHSKLFMRAILDAYQGFDEVKVLVDVGGGFGSSLSLITARYPHIKGINFDQPHVIEACPELPGVEHVSGNMFESVPSGGDAIFLMNILHNWDDESCIKLLKNCYKALPAHGKVVAVDSMLPEAIDLEGGDPMAFQMDVIMLTFNESGARERTERDVCKLGLAAEFTQVTITCQVDAHTVVEFLKFDPNPALRRGCEPPSDLPRSDSD